MFVAVKHINKEIREADCKLRALSSLNQAEYEELLILFDQLVTRKIHLYTLKGKLRKRVLYKEASDSSLPGSQSKLDFLLMYLKENPNQAYHACLFEMSQSKVSEWISFLNPVLEESLIQVKVMPQTTDQFQLEDDRVEFVIADVVERNVPRRSDHEAQEEEYSGKKKLHTIKNLAITDPKGRILYLGSSYEGSVHDKTIWDEMTVKVGNVSLLMDLGFLGADKDCETVILPFKKPKKKELRPLQKQINQAISKARVVVEHAFAGVKRLKIIRNKIRLKSYEHRDRVMRIAAALHNLRLQFRSP